MEEIDTLEHLFFDCEMLQPFWNSFKYWWKSNFDFWIDLLALDILLQIHVPLQGNMNDLLNFCILHAKAFIFKKKYLKFNIFVYDFLRELKCKVEI